MVGAVGKDATWPIDELKKRNVKVDGVQMLEGTPTGRAFIQVSRFKEECKKEEEVTR